MLTLNAVWIKSNRPEALAAFYESVFGKPPERSEHEPGSFVWQLGQATLIISEQAPMSGSVKGAGRIGLGFESDDLQAEFARLMTLGAAAIRAPDERDGVWGATLADPDGNEFQLTGRRAPAA